jgi:hypothetical protein
MLTLDDIHFNRRTYRVRFDRDVLSITAAPVWAFAPDQ